MATTPYRTSPLVQSVALPYWPHDTVFEEHVSSIDKAATAADLFASTMLTDAMEPTIERGIGLAFRWVGARSGVLPKDGDIVASYVCPFWAGQTLDDKNPQPCLIRRYFKGAESGKITLKADNPTYAEITEEVNDDYIIEIVVCGVLAPEFQSSRHINKKDTKG